MTDIADSMARYIDNIPDGAVHTCSDLCIKAPCLIVRGKQEIERLRYAIKLERGKTEKADADNDALRSRLAEAEALLREALPAVQSYARKHGRAVVAAARRNDADHAAKHAAIEQSAWGLADKIRAYLPPDSASGVEK